MPRQRSARTRRASVAAGGLLVAGIGALGWLVLLPGEPRRAVDAPAGPVLAAGEPPPSIERCAPQSDTAQAIAPPGPGPAAPVTPQPAEAPQLPPLIWAGDEDEPPVRPAAPPQERLPTGIAFQSIAATLGDVFTTMNAPPPDKGFERSFQEYTDNLSTKLQLEGDRADLSTVRIAFFDRRTQAAGDLRAQDETLRRFLQAVGVDAALGAEALKFVEQASALDGLPLREREWPFGDSRLFVSVTPSYGSGVIEVRRLHPPGTQEGGGHSS
jgi:hypothetical protein